MRLFTLLQKKEALAKSLASREDVKSEVSEKKDEPASVDNKSDSGIETSVVYTDEVREHSIERTHARTHIAHTHVHVHAHIRAQKCTARTERQKNNQIDS